MKLQTTPSEIKGLNKLLPLVNDMNSVVEELCIGIIAAKDGIYAQVVNSNSHNVKVKLKGSNLKEGSILVQSNYVSELTKKLPNEGELYIVGDSDVLTFDLLSLGKIQKPVFSHSENELPFKNSPLSKEVDWNCIISPNNDIPSTLNNIVSFSSKDSIIYINKDRANIKFMAKDHLGNSVIRCSLVTEEDLDTSIELVIKRYIADFIKSSKSFSLYNCEYSDIYRIDTEEISFIFRSVPNTGSFFMVNESLMELEPICEIQIPYERLLAASEWQSTGLSPIDTLGISISEGDLKIKGKTSTEAASIQMLSLLGEWQNIDVNNCFFIKLLSSLKLNNHNLSIKLVTTDPKDEETNLYNSVWLVIEPSISFNGKPTGLFCPSVFLS